jgi:hypothetical protein
MLCFSGRNVIAETFGQPLQALMPHWEGYMGRARQLFGGVRVALDNSSGRSLITQIGVIKADVVRVAI